ncbi:MAG: methyltransferase [Pseudorhodoplanes sp.]|nr:methyltransferase [Pseudorhodoplanes sp.]
MRPDGEPLTDDAALAGRLKLLQPRRGHRFGHDAILLAASVPARAGERVVELGSGVGAAGLALMARVPDLHLTMIEIEPMLAALASENAARNGFGGRTRIVTADASGDLAAPGLVARAADHVLMNPPFETAGGPPSPDPLRQRAHAGSRALLEAWLQNASWLLHAGGTVTVIWRADGAERLCAALATDFRRPALRLVHGRAGEAPIRILANAVKNGASSADETEMLPPLVLNDTHGRPTADAEAVMRHAASLARQVCG